MNGTEKQVTVNSYSLAALEWNPRGRIKIIASHGWLDNAASFSRLAPLLEDCHVFALDLAGHGHSDHKPSQATYNVWDDLTDILAVADALGWEQFHLLGHSRGAIISLLLSAAMPDRIRSLVMLDGLLPKPVSHQDTAKQLGRFLKDNLKPGKGRHRGYESLEMAIKVRCRAIDMSEESAEPIVKRGLVEQEGRFHWRTDPRLTNASAFKLTDAHNRALLNDLVTPARIFWSKRGIASSDYFVGLLKEYPAFQPVEMEGSHHFHLEQVTPALAERINGFYKGW